jgi:hypothetical protein
LGHRRERRDVVLKQLKLRLQSLILRLQLVLVIDKCSIRTKRRFVFFVELNELVLCGRGLAFALVQSTAASVLPLFGCPAAIQLAILNCLVFSDANAVIKSSVKTSLRLNMVLQFLDPVQVKFIERLEERHVAIVLRSAQVCNILDAGVASSFIGMVKHAGTGMEIPSLVCGSNGFKHRYQRVGINIFAM